ncbi:uncharacterized protein BO88DRAFT_305017, partial [Aspergillus vadensis CBS 113365]
ELPRVPAKYWGRDELFACRVICQKRHPSILPLLKGHTDPSDALTPGEIVKFIEGPRSTYISQSERGLVRDPVYGISLGQTWAALAAFLGPNKNQTSGKRGYLEEEEDDEVDRMTLRPRHKKLRKEDSDEPGTISFDSNSNQSESSHGDSWLGYIELNDQGPPEDGTLQLLSSVLRHILYYGIPQDGETSKCVVEYRYMRASLSAFTEKGRRKISAVDDGGLCLRRRVKDAFVVTKDRVAIIEAKRDFQSIQDGRPVISEKRLAQMTREALVARMSDPNANNYYSVIPIHAVQRYMCFLQFIFTPGYVEDFDSEAPSCFIHVTPTQWFDMNSKSHRKLIVHNVCGIMRW